MITRLKSEIETLKSQLQESESKQINNEQELKKKDTIILELENRLKNQNNQDVSTMIDKLREQSINIISAFGTQEDIESIHLATKVDAGPRMV